MHSNSSVAIDKRIARRCIVLQPTEEGIEAAGKALREGRLVAFPTETVYGLGANALDKDAVLSIFKTKGRPLTDPVIVHVPSAERALDFVNLKESGAAVFETLTSIFWPGPLTIVARARDCLDPIVSAGTGFVGVRSPSHPLAHRLLVAAGVPVAAPSANRFGHVSPTCAAHVITDLGSSDIYVLEAQTDEAAVPVCAVGIESTVAKIDEEAREVVIFRRGGVPEDQIRAALGAMDLQPAYQIRVQSKAAVKMDTEEGQQAPGQMVTHYAPDVPTRIVHLVPQTSTSGAPSAGITSEPFAPLAKSVVIDYGGRLSCLRPHVLAYCDLSAAADMSEAATALFASLRWAEEVAGAAGVLLADVSTCKGAHTAAVQDRMFRAASGVTITMTAPPPTPPTPPAPETSAPE